MIGKTTGIVLHSIKYGETSLICRILTSEYGLQSYLVQGVRKTKSRFPQNLFQPLTRVELVAYQKEHGNLHRIREIHCLHPFDSIPFNILKTSIALFISELLLVCLKESDSSPELFEYLQQCLEFLDKTQGKVSDFHLVFMLQLAGFLGFAPRSNQDENHTYFDLREGLFQKYYQASSCLDREQSHLLHQLLHTGFDQLGSHSIGKAQRRLLLQRLLDYYRLHLVGLREIHSHLILEEVLG